jgi:hypothetical protein
VPIHILLDGDGVLLVDEDGLIPFRLKAAPKPPVGIEGVEIIGILLPFLVHRFAMLLGVNDMLDAGGMRLPNSEIRHMHDVLAMSN